MKIATVAVLLTALAATPATAQVTPILPDGTILDVSAEGRTTRVPDVATIRAGVVTQGATAAAALAQNAQRMARVTAAVKRTGVAPRDLQTASVTLSPQYRYGENQPPIITGYQATNTLSVLFRDVGKAGAVLDALVAEGANQIDGPSLSIDSPDAALDEARADAVKRARARAELYARAAGLSVSRIVSISESSANNGNPNPPVVFLQRAKEADASTSIAPGEAEVSITLSVRFLLK